MFRQMWTVVLAVLAALGSLALATAQEPKESGGKMKSPPKELTVDLGKGVRLEMVLIPAGEFMMGCPIRRSTPKAARSRSTGYGSPSRSG